MKEGKGRDKDRDNREKEVEDNKKEKRKYLLFDVIEEVKLSVSKGNFEEEVESDDHDSA